jgi:hypothetical protein
VRAQAKEEEERALADGFHAQADASIARLMMLSTPVTSSTGTTKRMPPMVGVPVLT